MTLINKDGTATEIVVVTQAHLAALISIAASAVKLSRDIDALIAGGQQVHYHITQSHVPLKRALEKYGATP